MSDPLYVHQKLTVSIQANRFWFHVCCWPLKTADTI